MATANSPNYVEIDGVPLRTPAWKAGNWDDLYGQGELRGDDDVIPGVNGEEHRDKQRGPLRALITLRVFGHLDSDGDPHSNVWAGLHENLDELRPLADPGVVTVSIYHDSTKVLEGDGEVVGGFRPQFEAGRHADVVLDVKIHDGRLEEPT